MTTLPTPRTLLNSLLKTLTTPPDPNPTVSNPALTTPSNPLKDLPPSHRALLTALHVLFPPPMLLQALDLLDRGLVTRLIEKPVPASHSYPSKPAVISSSTTDGEDPEQNHEQDPAPRDREAPPAATAPGPLRERRNVMYQVQSARVSKSRFREPASMASLPGGPYTVRLRAWNCSCAAFAFAAFPAGREGAEGGAGMWGGLREEMEWGGGGGGGFEMGMAEDRGREMEEMEECAFGGLARGEHVPVCKHLLASLLAEKWEGVLGSYVMEREVGRAEIAGRGGEG